MNNARFGTLANLYHQPRQPMQGGQPQTALGQPMGQMLDTQTRQPRPQTRNPYNAGGSGAMNAIIWQLMNKR